MNNISGLLRGYDSVDYPVVAVSGGNIVFLNRAAQTLSEYNYLGHPVIELLGKRLASFVDGDVTCAVGDCTICGQQFALEFFADDPSIYIFKNTPPAPDGALRELAALSGAIRLPVSEILQSLDLVSPTIIKCSTCTQETCDQQKSEHSLRYLSIMERSCFKLIRLASRLDSLNALTSPDPPQDLRQEDLVEYVSNTVDKVKLMFEELNASITFASPLESAVTLIDRQYIESMIMILLSNAAEATRNSKNNVTVSVGETQSSYSIVVEDTGCGLNPDNISSIFSPTLLPEPYLSMPGLGISIAWAIARLHGGGLLLEGHKNGTKVVAYIAKREGPMMLRQPLPYNRDMHVALTEFSKLLPSDFFHKYRTELRGRHK